MDPTPIDITDDNDATDHLISTAVSGENSVHDVTFQFQLQQAIQASLKPKTDEEEDFMVYFKGLVSHETVTNNIKMSFVGIGVAICDSTGSCLFESSKSGLLEADGDGGRGAEGDRVELEALVEALGVADARLRLKRVRIVTDCDSVYRYLTGERHSTNHKIAALVDKVNLIKSKFVYHALFHLKQSLIMFVYRLARNAIKSETAKWVGSNSDSDVTVTEQCRICFEYLETGQLFPVNKCQHRYCFSCIGKHIEAKLLDGKLPECPHEKCDSKIGIESCKKLLKPELYRSIMRSRVNEAFIPPTDKVYCPFSDCSALMSKTEVKVHTPTSSFITVGDTGM
ncbi:E3 ubiquitin-protein ligase RSL1-like [Bidens hawaiensis]|uniref:E3 ubiquitin-protein ligase RSL1-like n=1 Tax=Bidens hawaiensis TaxID=980011 RepID=UPI00404B36E3